MRLESSIFLDFSPTFSMIAGGSMHDGKANPSRIASDSGKRRQSESRPASAIQKNFRT
jgi:hypothetical protein